MKAWRLLAALLLAGQAWPEPTATSDVRPNVPSSVTQIRRFLQVDRTDAERVRKEYERLRHDLDLHVSPEALAKDPAACEKALRKLGDAEFKKAAAAAARLYELAGFEAVHDALKSQWIDKGGSAAVAAIRNEMLARACDRVASKHGSIGANNFSVARSVKSDIDFTLFPRWHDPKCVVPVDEKGNPLTGKELQKRFYDAYRELWGVEANRMEIVAHAAEATVPDWRGHQESDRFAVEFRRGSQMLIENPEAYFLEGAYRMQIERRSFKEKEPLFTVHNGNLAGEGVDRREFRLAQDAVFRSVPPDLRRGYAFGAASGNHHFFQHHSGDPLHFTKYVLRSVEDGMRLLHMPPDADVFEWKAWKDVDAEGRRKVLAEAYPEKGPFSRAEVEALLQKCVQVRAAADSYDPMAIWAEEARALHREKGNPGAPAPDQMPDLVKEAQARFEDRCRKLMLHNCVETARARAADFTDAEGLVRRMREREKAGGPKILAADEKGLVRKLKLATYYELYIAFHGLDAETRARIIAAAPNEEARKLYEKVERRVAFKEDLLKFPAAQHAEDPKAARSRWEAMKERWKEEKAKAKGVYEEFLRDYRTGGYEKPALRARARQWFWESLGCSYESELWAAEKALGQLKEKLDRVPPQEVDELHRRSLHEAEQRLKGTFEPKKLLANVANAGNLDSLLSVIRTGQETGWDGAQVGMAAFMQAAGNLPYMGPILAVKGAVIDGQPLGLGVMVGAYFCPGIGQAYLVYSIADNTYAIASNAYEAGQDGMADMMIEGISPDDSTGAVGVIHQVWEASVGSLAGVEGRPHAKFCSVLRAVPGGTTAERKKAFFAFVDGILEAKMRAYSFEPLKWDPRKEEVVQAFFGTWLRDFEQATGPFADDAYLRTFWQSPELCWRQKQWLKDVEYRKRVIAKLTRMYILGLHERSMKEGIKVQAEADQAHLDLVDEVASFEDNMRREARDAFLALGEMTGAIDYPEIRLPKLEEPRPEGRILLLPPRTAPTSPGEMGMDLRSAPATPVAYKVADADAPAEIDLDLNLPTLIEARAEETKGHFQRPFRFDWSFPELQPRMSRDEAEGIGGQLAELGKDPKLRTVLLRVSVEDDAGQPVGKPAEIRLRISTKPKPKAPHGLKTRRDGAITWVSFRSDGISDPRKPVYRIYRALSPKGPWEHAGDLFSAGSSGRNPPYRNTGPDSGEVRVSTYRERSPTWFKVCEELEEVDPDNPCLMRKAGEVESAVLPPSAPAIGIRLGEAWIQEGEPLVIDPSRKDHAFGLRMAVDDQAFNWQGAHFKVTWGGKVRHAWSEREGPSSYVHAHDAEARLELPWLMGEQALTVEAEAPDGAKARRVLRVRYDPPWRAEYEAKAAAPLDADEGVKSQLESLAQAPGKIQECQQNIQAHMQEGSDPVHARLDLLHWQAGVQVELARARHRALLGLSDACWTACQWDRDLALRLQYLREGPEIARMRRAYEDQRQALRADPPQDVERRRKDIENDAWAEVECEVDRILRDALDAADDEAYRFAFQKRLDLLDRNRYQWDAETVARHRSEAYRDLAHATALLTGDRGKAASFWMRYKADKGQYLPPWWPEEKTEPKPAEDPKPEEARVLAQRIAERTRGNPAAPPAVIQPPVSPPPPLPPPPPPPPRPVQPPSPQVPPLQPVAPPPAAPPATGSQAAGDAAFARGDLNAALAAYSAALKENPGNPAALAQRGHVYGLRGQVDWAVPDYRKALRLKPDEPHVRLSLAELLVVSGRLDEADKEIRILEATSQPDAWVATLRGQWALKRGDAGAARTAFAEALKRDPNQAGTLIGQAHRLIEWKQYDRALLLLDASEGMAPGGSGVPFGRGRALAAAGRKSEAAAAYRRFLELDPQSAWAPQARAAIEELERP